MKPSGKVWLSFAVVCAVLAQLVAPAAADSYSFKDKHDIANRSALDIRSARVGHKGDKLLHAVGLERKATPKGFAKIHGFIDFLINTTGDWSDGPQRRIYVLGGSRFRVVVTNKSGREILGRGKVHHPSPGTVGAIVSPNLLGNPDGYLWFTIAVSNAGAVVDAAPNKISYIHDLTAPRVTSPLDADVTSAITDATTASVPLTATIRDKGFMDTRAATIRWRVNGDTDWRFGATKKWDARRSLDARLLPRSLTRRVSFAQGTTADTCISAMDFGANWSATGTTTFQVPYDQKSSVFGRFTTTATLIGDYGGSHDVMTTKAPDNTITITVPAGLQTDLMVAPTGNSFGIDVNVNGPGSGSFTQADVSDGLLDISSVGGFKSSGTDIIVITVTSGEFDLDGYLGAPAPVAPAALAKCGGRPTVSVAPRAFGKVPSARILLADRLRPATVR